MGAKNNSKILLALILLSMLYSQTWTLPDLEAEILRKARHADGVSTSDISGLLDAPSPKDYPESLIEKRASNDISEDQRRVKRQSKKVQFPTSIIRDILQKAGMENKK